jgi:thioredoxin 1
MLILFYLTFIYINLYSMKYFMFFVMLTSVMTIEAQIELTDDDAEKKLLINNDRLIVLDFYATWCGPCKIMDPILKELAKEYEDTVDFYKIDVDKNDVDDALSVDAIPTYFFLLNSTNLNVTEGAMSKNEMREIIDELLRENSNASTSSLPNDSNSVFYDANAVHGDLDEFSISTIAGIWDESTKLNSLAWHIYEQHDEEDILFKAIEVVMRSIELEETYYNADTLAALYFKIGKYKQALKKAKRAIQIAKRESISYTTTTELINAIIDQM